MCRIISKRQTSIYLLPLYFISLWQKEYLTPLVSFPEPRWHTLLCSNSLPLLFLLLKFLWPSQTEESCQGSLCSKASALPNDAWKENVKKQNSISYCGSIPRPRSLKNMLGVCVCIPCILMGYRDGGDGTAVCLCPIESCSLSQVHETSENNKKVLSRIFSFWGWNSREII